VADALHRIVEFRLTPAGDVDGRAFLSETRCGGEADAAAAAGHQHDLAGVFAGIDVFECGLIHELLLWVRSVDHDAQLISCTHGDKYVSCGFFIHNCG
jgi:hypothetical protein